MTHRAEQIVERAQTVISAFSGLSINGSNVYAHLTLSLDDASGELDAISVNAGDDDPIGDFGTDNTSFIDSLLTVPITARCKGTDEINVRRALMNLRRQIHQALMGDDALGLGFVVGVFYGGASALEIDTSTDEVVALQESRWRVHYRMSFTDPGA